MATVLTIGSDTLTFTPPINHDFWIDAWGWDLDSDQWLEFHERPGNGQPSYYPGAIVSLEIDSVIRAAGEIVSVSPDFSDGWTFGYRVRGWKYLCNKIPVTAIDGTGNIAFNLRPDDEDYLPSFAGLTVGDILAYVLTQHASQLTALGISTDATTTSQLAALDLVPAEAVFVSGERLANAIDSVLQRWARNVVFCILASGVVRFFDTTDLTDLTLTEGDDPIEPVRFSRDISDCATAVEIRGAGRIYPAFVSELATTLTPAWDSGQQDDWTLDDFVAPNDAYDEGTIASGGILGPTSVRVTSSDSSREWPSNFWPDRQAWIHLYSSVGSALTFTEARPITANDALTAGGTSDITLGIDLENAGSSAYDSYKIVGTYAPLGSGGFERNNVYRLFDVTDPGGLVSGHLVKKFPVPQPFISYSGDAVAGTNYPIAVVVYNGQTFPVSFKVLPASGQILFDEPVVKPFNSVSTLEAGGAGVTYPDDLYVMLAYSRGPLTARYPSSGFSGTAYSGPEALSRVQVVDLDSWIYEGNVEMVEKYAEMLHKSMCDTVLSGIVQYRGAYEDAFEPGSRLSIDATCYTTGEETAKVPIRSFTLRYNNSGTPQIFTSTLTCSSRRNPTTGDRQFTHLTQLGQVGFKFNWQGLDYSRTNLGGFQPSLADADPRRVFDVSDPTNLL